MVERRLPAEAVGFRSARTRGHPRRHAGGGEDVGVGEGMAHQAGMVARSGMPGKRRHYRSPAGGTTGVTETRTRTRLPGSKGSRERYLTPLCT
jgi:hypothetical protein